MDLDWDVRYNGNHRYHTLHPATLYVLERMSSQQRLYTTLNNSNESNASNFPLLAARARLVLSHASLLLRPYFGNPLARPVVMIPFAARTKELRVAGPRPSWCQKAEDVNAVMRKGVLVTRICRHRVLGSLLKLHMQKCWVRPIPSSDFAS
uniref:Uncharacterized protein n=1 Tax=Melanopsichium pennsylvanicum 4 TaxID=1398559 RepID=A0A077QYQ9_9BASI|nr:uncharacterized protein BN887_06324 [Melanopsichium pennsylvanicum 4]